MAAQEQSLTALLIAPNRDLAQQFLGTIPQTRAFQVLADLKAYPPQQTLELRLRQLRPDVVLLDLSSDLETAGQVLRVVATLDESIQVVGLHTHNDSEAILRSLRMGASEFFYAPFQPSIQLEALARIRRLRWPEPAQQAPAGRVIVFASAKPGSGASTLATQTAFALQNVTGKRVLLADFDLTGGSIGFHLKADQSRSAVDALREAENLDRALWMSLVGNCCSVDVLPGPETPFLEAVDPARLHLVLEYARSLYDWVVIDLPVIFQRASLMAVSEADRAFLVSTSELPSLHLARKAVNLLGQLGFPKERFQIVVNRISKRDDIAGGDIEKLFNCTVHTKVPNDQFSLHRAVTLGQPIERTSELGRAVESLAAKVSATPESSQRKPGDKAANA